MSIEEKIEANANRLLWCVHIAGPDDLYAEPTHASAVAKADEHNRMVWSRPNAPEDVCCFAYADVWPWEPAAHEDAMKKQDAEEASC